MTAWRIGPDVRDWHEWARHCETQTKKVDPGQAALYMELAASRQYWEGYLTRLEEEKVAVQAIHATALSANGLTRFELPHLQRVYVLKGTTYQLINGRVCLSHNQATVPVTRPLSKWRGDTFRYSIAPSLREALKAVASKVSRLRFDGLSIQNHITLVSDTAGITGHHEITKLVSLRIRCGLSRSWRLAAERPYLLCGHLNLSPDLETLHIDLLHRYRDYESAPMCSIRTVQDTFGMEIGRAVTGAMPIPDLVLTWPKLRKLSLGYFDSSPRALISLVTRHSSTLRDLRLDSIWLDDKGDSGAEKNTWCDIFGIIRTSTALENLALSGRMCNIQHENDAWDFDDEVSARAVANWIVSGGECPWAPDSRGL